MSDMDLQRLYSTKPLQINNIPNVGTKKTSSNITGNSAFNNILHEKMDKVVFSHHAQMRMQARNINITDEELAKINVAIDMASKKGSQETVLFMKDLAFVTSVKNKTVITVVDGENLKDNIFTNIDSAMLI